MPTKKESPLSKFAKTVKPVAAAPKQKTAAKKPAKTEPAKALPSSEEEFKYPPGWKAPKNAAAAADLYYQIRQDRLALEKQAAAVEEKEKAYKHWLITQLPVQKASGISGKLARVSLSKKDVPRAKDWTDIYASIVADYNKKLKKKDGQQDSAFAILNRALSASTISEMWAAGVEIPGVDHFTMTSLSLNKL